MPSKGEKFYIGTEEDGTKVYWYPYDLTKEYHKPDGSVETERAFHVRKLV